jgi:Transcriptional regulator
MYGKSTKRVYKKDAIDRAAMELFARQGFAGTTIKDIAKKADVTEGALYRHYAGKEEMASELFEKEVARIGEHLSGLLESADSPRNRLKAAVEYLYSGYRDDPWPLLFVILNFQNLQENSVLHEKKHIYDYIVDYLYRVFRDEPGERDYEQLSTLITGIILQPVIVHYYRKASRHPVEQVDAVASSCCLLAGVEP